MTAVSDLLNKWASEAKALRQESLNLPALVIDDCTKELRAAIAADTAVAVTDKVDELIATIESKGLGWSLDHTGILIEARIWDWPNVVGRYRPATVEPLHDMLMKALAEVKP